MWPIAKEGNDLRCRRAAASRRESTRFMTLTLDRALACLLIVIGLSATLCGSRTAGPRHHLAYRIHKPPSWAPDSRAYKVSFRGGGIVLNTIELQVFHLVLQVQGRHCALKDNVHNSPPPSRQSRTAQGRLSATTSRRLTRLF